MSLPVIIGTYRRRKHMDECMDSMFKHLKGVDEIIFVDDGDDPDTSDYLRTFGHVEETRGQGYRAAYQAICRMADGKAAFVLEEDFTFTSDVDAEEMYDMLYHRPYLAQVVCLRGPHFPIEHHHGGVIEALKAKGHKFTEVNGLIEHTACFSANPGVWRGEVFASGWPFERWSEEIKGRRLAAQGYRFAYLPGIRVEHHGEREGHGY